MTVSSPDKNPNKPTLFRHPHILDRLNILQLNSEIKFIHEITVFCIKQCVFLVKGLIGKGKYAGKINKNYKLEI